jgi:hypothetical protein
MRVIVVGRALAIGRVHYNCGETLGVDDDVAKSLIQGGRVKAVILESDSSVHTASSPSPPKHRQARVRRRVSTAKDKGAS